MLRYHLMGELYLRAQEMQARTDTGLTVLMSRLQRPQSSVDMLMRLRTLPA